MYQIKSEYVVQYVHTSVYVTLSNHTFRGHTIPTLSQLCECKYVCKCWHNFLHWFYGTHSSLHVFNRGPYVGAPDLSLKLLELVGSHGVSLSSPLESKGQEESSLSGRAGEWREGVGGGGGRGGRGRGGGRRGWGGFGDITGVVHHRLDNNNIERKRCLNVSRPSQESVNVICIR